MAPGAAAVGLTIREAAPVAHALDAARVTAGCEPRIDGGQAEPRGGPPTCDAAPTNACQAKTAASATTITAAGPTTNHLRFRGTGAMPHNRAMVACPAAEA